MNTPRIALLALATLTLPLLACGGGDLPPPRDAAADTQPAMDTPAPPSDSGPAGGCQEGLRLCSASCVDITNDPNHCGRCNNPCPSGQECRGSMCVMSCPTPQRSCGGSCVDITRDPANCGGCGSACPGGQLCVGARCVADCSAPRMMCGATCVDTATDPMNCGRCNNACPGGQRCASGACVPTCTPPQILCAGACVNPTNDRNNCGRCGNTCTGTLPFCVLSTCLSADNACLVPRSCSSCDALPNCGWCDDGGSGACMAGNDAGPTGGASCSGTWAFHRAMCPSPDPCADSTDCASCSSRAGCGWCAASSTCMSGTATGPSGDASCPSAQWHYYPAFCSSPCSTYSTCADCTGDVSCGWCNGVGHCMAGGSTGPDTSAACTSSDWAWTSSACM